MIPIPVDEPVPLFPVGFKALPIFGWRAYPSNINQSVTHIGQGTSLALIPSGVIAIIWYHDPAQVSILPKTLDYGDVRPKTFFLPDGTTRINSTSMSVQAYQQLLDRLEANPDPFPT